MKLLFCGTPEFSVPTLRHLCEAGQEIRAVITPPDRPQGRGLRARPSPVKLAAEEFGLPIEQPEKIKGGAGQALLRRYEPDAVVIVGYGQIIPADLLPLPRFGWINLHASLLPRYRGAAPVQWAILRGENYTGVTIMRIDEGLDTGPILLQRQEPIGEEDTAVSLGMRLAEVGAELIALSLELLAEGSLEPQAQDPSQATHAPLLKKEDGRVDWAWPAREIYNRIRGLVPWPGAHTRFRGKLLHLWWGKPIPAPPGDGPMAPGTLRVEKHQLAVACGEGGWLDLQEVQPENRDRLTATDFINGMHVKSGERFSDSR